MGMNQPGQSNQQVEQAKQMWSNLTRGRQIALAAAVVGLIASFLPWYSISGTGIYDGSANGWSDWRGYLAILGLLVAGAVVLLPLFGRSARALIPSLPPTLTDARLVMGAGVVTLVAALLYLLTVSKYSGSFNGASAGPSLGLYIDLVCGAAVAAGGYLMQTEPDLV